MNFYYDIPSLFLLSTEKEQKITLKINDDIN